MGRTKRGRQAPLGVGGKPALEPAGSVVDDTSAITLGVASTGRAFIAPVEPAAVRRLSPYARDVLARLGGHADSMLRMQEHLEQLVEEAREAGVSWHTIGWSLGMTGEGARRAFGGRYAGEED